MHTTKMEPAKALQKYFGFNKFKGEQEAVINNLLNGNNTFVIMPTGGGKSLCYQLPAIISQKQTIFVNAHTEHFCDVQRKGPWHFKWIARGSQSRTVFHDSMPWPIQSYTSYNSMKPK